jgi:signal transduction histidine kinase
VHEIPDSSPDPEVSYSERERTFSAQLSRRFGRSCTQSVIGVGEVLTSLGQTLPNLLCEVAPCKGASLRIVVLGKPRALNPATQEQFFLIGREAIINALRHSRSTTIEVEVQYLRDLLCLLVRDNGCGINPDKILRVRDSHWGLRRTRNRTENSGARFGKWSRRGAGTEVRVAMPVDVTNRRSLIHIVSMCFGWRNRR